MSPPYARGIYYIAFAAVFLHALLFFAVRPRVDPPARLYDRIPSTRFLTQSSRTIGMSEAEVRTVSSPVIFSLPSSMGFSRGLFDQDVKTVLNTFSRPEQKKSFLEVSPENIRSPELINSSDYMISSGRVFLPGLPESSSLDPEKKPAARRVTVAPELKERLVGGITLPAALNQPAEKPWEVRASVSVSEAGFVQHVFLDKPLESPELTSQVLQLLHGLRFKPGDDIEGRVEIYSNEETLGQEVAP